LHPRERVAFNSVSNLQYRLFIGMHLKEYTS